MTISDLASKLSRMTGKRFASCYGRIGRIVKTNEESLILNGLDKLLSTPKLIYYTQDEVLNILQRYISIEKNKNEVGQVLNDLDNWTNSD